MELNLKRNGLDMGRWECNAKLDEGTYTAGVLISAEGQFPILLGGERIDPKTVPNFDSLLKNVWEALDNLDVVHITVTK